MTTKLTLTVQEDTIKKAKEYAKQTGRSISSLVENYLKSLSSTSPVETKYSPQLKKLIGCAKLPQDFDYKKEMTESLVKKYLS